MAAATIAEIREGLAANLVAVFGNTVNVSAYQTDPVIPPHIEVAGVDRLTYDTAAAFGLDDFIFVIQGFGGPTSRGAQEIMDGWMDRGTQSVKNAIEASRTLGGKVQDAFVISASRQRPTKFPDGTTLLTCEWQIRVLNTGA